MPRIDRWVIRNTLAWLSDRCRSAEPDIVGRWGINLSGDSLSDSDFCHELIRQVRAAKLPWHSVLRDHRKRCHRAALESQRADSNLEVDGLPFCAG